MRPHPLLQLGQARRILGHAAFLFPGGGRVGDGGRFSGCNGGESVGKGRRQRGFRQRHHGPPPARPVGQRHHRRLRLHAGGGAARVEAAVDADCEAVGFRGITIHRRHRVAQAARRQVQVQAGAGAGRVQVQVGGAGGLWEGRVVLVKAR